MTPRTPAAAPGGRDSAPVPMSPAGHPGTGAGAGTGRPASVNPGGLGVDTNVPPRPFRSSIPTPSLGLPSMGMMGYDQKALTPHYKALLDQMNAQGGFPTGLTPSMSGSMLTPTAALFGGMSGFPLATPMGSSTGAFASSPSPFNAPLGVSSPSEMLGSPSALLESPIPPRR